MRAFEPPVCGLNAIGTSETIPPELFDPGLGCERSVPATIG
jgi:hypothetical protein